MIDCSRWLCHHGAGESAEDAATVTQKGTHTSAVCALRSQYHTVHGTRSQYHTGHGTRAQYHTVHGTRAQYHTVHGTRAQYHTVHGTRSQYHTVHGTRSQYHTGHGTRSQYHTVHGTRSQYHTLADWRLTTVAVICTAQNFTKHCVTPAPRPKVHISRLEANYSGRYLHHTELPETLACRSPLRRGFLYRILPELFDKCSDCHWQFTDTLRYSTTATVACRPPL
jgi:hypothetical protein